MMPNSIFQHSHYAFTYNHRLYSGRDELNNFAIVLSRSHLDWEQSIGRFLLAWFDDSADIEMWTSGSTGEPKKIAVPKSAMLASAKRTLSFFKLKTGQKALLCLSPDFVAGKMMIVRAILGELNLLCHGISSNPLKELKETVEFSALVPTQVWLALKESKPKFDLVSHIIVGGAALDSDLALALKELPTKTWETYGMTETVSHIALRPVGDKVNPFFEVLEGTTIGIDQRSCLFVEPSEINRHRIQTNDVVKLVDKNKFIIRGRFDNLINSGGVKVFPEEVEQFLSDRVKVPFIVTSMPDKKWGQKVVIVFESQTMEIDFNVLFAGLEKHKVPRQAFFVPSFPMTGSGKVKRTRIQELILEISQQSGR